MERSVIVAARRSPIGRFLGGLSKIPAPQLGAMVATAVLEETAGAGAVIDEVFVGCVLQAGLGQNPARQVALRAGISDGVTALTLNKVCGSSLESVMQADRAIRCGDLHVALTGGIESMSLAPYYLSGARVGLKFGDGQVVDGMRQDGLICPFEHWIMGAAAEHIARTHSVSRQQQDEYAARSHAKAAAAAKAGLFDRQIVPIETRSGLIAADETIRTDATIENLSKLPAVFDSNGTVTAANASTISDGAAMLVVASESAARRHGWTPRMEILATTTVGVAPKELFTAPVFAARKVADKAGLTLGDIDLLELNEAFAAQCVANIKTLEIPMDRVNVHGGAIALGHPIGASGARILVTLIHAMEQRGATHGIACLCLGGGNAVAVCIRRCH